MRVIWPAISFSLIVALAPATTSAAVMWERQAQTITAQPTDEAVVFTFPFTVTEQSLSFLPMELPCGCTQAAADRPRYAPGDQGTYTVTVHVEDRVGTKAFRIPVRTDATPDTTEHLDVTAIIPQIITADPRILIWTGSDRSASRTATVRIAEPFRITTARATPADPAITAVTRVISGHEFQVELRWGDPAHRQPISIAVVTDLPIQRQATVTLWAVNHIRP